MEVQPTKGSWRTGSPSEVMSWLSCLTVSWWIAGGWALDLFVGAQGRVHGDLDVGVLRSEIMDVLVALPLWEFFEAKEGVLTRLDAGNAPRAEVNSLWCRPASSSIWALELVLDQSEQDRWVFRRDARIQRPLATVIQHSPEGIPYLAPEIQLLYKARNVRPQDQADFDRVVPQLDVNARAWLKWALCTVEPDHKWISMLDPHRTPEEDD